MTELKLTLPPQVSAEEATVLLAATLYQRGTLSLGQAAELAGHSKRAFMELLAKYSVAVFDYAPEELPGEIED